MRSKIWFFGLFVLALTLVACGGHEPVVRVPASAPAPTSRAAITEPFATAPPAAEAPAPELTSQSVTERYPGYTPKDSPDTARDISPALGAQLDALPAATLGDLPKLLKALAKAKKEAATKPGRMEPGNQILGADPEQYQPSDEELLESELGGRIEQVVAAEGRAKVAARIGKKSIRYMWVVIRHADVMGSGRYFYADAPAAKTIDLSP